MQLSSPQKIHDYPAEYLQFAANGKYWVMDAGPEMLVFEDNLFVNKFFMPGAWQWPVAMKSDGNFCRGLMYGNAGFAKINNRPDPLDQLMNDGVIPGGSWAWDTIAWNSSLNSFVGALKPLKSRDGKSNTAITRNYPIIYYDVETQTGKLLTEANVPADVIIFENEMFWVAQQVMHCYDADGNWQKDVKPEDSLQTDHVLTYDHGTRLCRVNAAGVLQTYQTNNDRTVSSFQLEGYQTKQPAGIGEGSSLITIRNTNELISMSLKKEIDLETRYAFDELITAIAVHPQQPWLLVGVNGGSKEGTHRITFSND